MKATAKQIFNEIQSLNPKLSTISSLGDYVSASALMVADSIFKSCIENVSKNSLAYTILTNSKQFSEKQIWIIAFELEKNETYSSKLGAEIERRNRIYNNKIEASKAKLSANKEASADVLASIKNAGKKLGDYYKWLNSSGNSFRKEYFSKKYTKESVNAFLSI